MALPPVKDSGMLSRLTRGFEVGAEAAAADAGGTGADEPPVNAAGICKVPLLRRVFCAPLALLYEMGVDVPEPSDIFLLIETRKCLLILAARPYKQYSKKQKDWVELLFFFQQTTK